MAYYLDPDYGIDALPGRLGQDGLFVADQDGNAAYGIDSTIFSDPGPVPTRTCGPQKRLDDQFVPLPSASKALDLSVSSRDRYPLVDGEFSASPFPVRSMTRDGRMKTRLMGVGHDGGFLTSPLIVGPPRTDSRATTRPPRAEISIDSPAPHNAEDSIQVGPLQRLVRARTASYSSEMAPSLSLGTTASSMDFTSGAMSTSTSMSANHSRDGQCLPYDDEPFRRGDISGLGMGLSGVPGLDVHTLDLFGPNRFEASDIDLSQVNLDAFSADLAAAERHPAAPDESANEMVDIRLTQSGRLVFGEQFEPVESGSLRRSRQAYADADARPVKALPQRSLNKAKSCSALSPSARQMAVQSPYYDEPMTPVSNHTSPQNVTAPEPSNAMASLNGFDRPADAPTGAPSQLLSFADLYHYGVAQEAALASSIRKSPLNQMPTDFQGVGLGVAGPPRRRSRQYSDSYSARRSVSSVSPPNVSDVAMDPALNYRTPTEMSSAIMYERPSTASSRSSLSSTHGSMSLNYSRPRRTSYMYRHDQGPYAGDYAHLGGAEYPPHPRMQQQEQPRVRRQPSAPSLYGSASRNFSYPTRYGPAQQPSPYEEDAPPPLPPIPQQYRARRVSQHSVPPQAYHDVQWAQPPPQIPLPPVPRTPRRERVNPHARCLTGPAGSMADYPIRDVDLYYEDGMGNEYERQLASYDSFYQLPAHQAPPSAMKRSREADDSAYARSPMSTDEEEQRPKRLRSVASAPCLPSRRLKPGPRPKTVKTPEQQNQSMFNATLSPPIPQIHRGASPFSSPLLPNDDGEFQPLDANGEVATTSTITYVPGPPALPGQPRSSVPREVIQSLYSHIPSHTTSSGAKVSKRYICLIEGCERSFPRKSAIESHIQTHLEDKPFICPHEDWYVSRISPTRVGSPANIFLPPQRRIFRPSTRPQAA